MVYLRTFSGMFMANVGVYVYINIYHTWVLWDSFCILKNSTIKNKIMVLHQCLPPAAHPGCMYESLPADRKSTVCPSALAAPLS